MLVLTVKRQQWIIQSANFDVTENRLTDDSMMDMEIEH